LAKKRAFEREGLDGRGLSNERDVSDSSKVVRETDSKICHDESLPKNPRVENGAEIGVADEAVNRKNLVKKKLSSKSAIKKSSNRDGNLPSNERKMFDGKSFKDSCRKLLEKVKVIIFNIFSILVNNCRFLSRAKKVKSMLSAKCPRSHLVIRQFRRNKFWTENLRRKFVGVRCLKLR
jgi:hypothetical protein